MPIAVRMESEQRGRDWWSFRVWIDGEAAGLDYLREVTYILPGSFAPPVRRVSHRASNFEITGNTSGPFKFHVSTRDAGGTVFVSEHELKVSPKLIWDGSSSLNAPGDTFGNAGFPIQVLSPIQPISGTARVIAGASADLGLPLLREGEFWAGIEFGSDAAQIFGCPPETTLIANYRRYAGTSAGSALRSTVSSFSVPATLDEVAAMPPGLLVAVERHASLDFEAAVDVRFVPNVLHTLSPGAPGDAGVDLEAPSGRIGVKWRISARYRFRIERHGIRDVVLGWFPFIDDATIVSATILDRPGLIGLFERFLQRESRAAETQLALEFALARRLELALTAELTALDAGAPVFLCEFDPDALDSQGAGAIGAALRGDLWGLGQADAYLPGVQVHRNVFEPASRAALPIDTTVIAPSSPEPAAEVQVAFTAGTGELAVSAGMKLAPFHQHWLYYGMEEETLRPALDEGFFATAVYRSGGQLDSISLPPAAHRYFASHPKASVAQVHGYLRIGQLLGLIGDQEIGGLATLEQPGRIDVRIAVSYDESATKSIFLDYGAPRSIEMYEYIGRKTMADLIVPGGDDNFRLRPLLDDGVWNELRENGPAEFRQWFGPLEAAVITSDYLTIVWWASAMRAASEIIGELETSKEEAEQARLRELLSKRLGEIAKRTRPRWGTPWGLVATYLASGRRGQARMEIIGRRFTLLLNQGVPVPEPVVA
jgi:hypothetical protein